MTIRSGDMNYRIWIIREGLSAVNFEETIIQGLFQHREGRWIPGETLAVLIISTTGKKIRPIPKGGNHKSA